MYKVINFFICLPKYTLKIWWWGEIAYHWGRLDYFIFVWNSYLGEMANFTWISLWCSIILTNIRSVSGINHLPKYCIPMAWSEPLAGGIVKVSPARNHLGVTVRFMWIWRVPESGVRPGLNPHYCLPIAWEQSIRLPSTGTRDPISLSKDPIGRGVLGSLVNLDSWFIKGSFCVVEGYQDVPTSPVIK